jgi:hypothetical protein
MIENFANAPKSITEIRGEKTNDGSQWKPRDALITMLRQIDSGEIDPEGLVVLWTERPEKPSHQPPCHFWNATPNPFYMLAMLTRTLYLVQHDMEID